METIILAFVVIGCVILAMSVGVIFSNKPIKGSCGGMSAVGLEGACDVCGGDSSLCEKENEQKGKSAERTTEFYDAS